MTQNHDKASLPDRVRAVILDAVQDQDNVDMAKVEDAVTAIVDSINRLVIETRTGIAPGIAQVEALNTLNAWFNARGYDVSASTPDAWNFTVYEEAFVFSAGQGRRSSTLYMVRGLSVLQLSSVIGASLEEAYQAMGGHRMIPPTAQETAAANAAVEDLNGPIAGVPETQRHNITGSKFADPVAEETMKTPTAPTADCGTCRYCDPPPSDITHFHRWAPRACERPVPLKEAR